MKTKGQTKVLLSPGHWKAPGPMTNPVAAGARTVASKFKFPLKGTGFLLTKESRSGNMYITNMEFEAETYYDTRDFFFFNDKGKLRKENLSL